MEKINWLRQLSKEKGKPVKALADMPVLFAYLEPVMEAFQMLSSSRTIGAMGGVGPISLGEILRYLTWVRLDSVDEEKKWIRFIRSLDNTYLRHREKLSQGK